jgi:hypothetical protein
LLCIVVHMTCRISRFQDGGSTTHFYVQYCIRMDSTLDVRPSNLQLMPWNFQIQYSYLLIIPMPMPVLDILMKTSSLTCIDLASCTLQFRYNLTKISFQGRHFNYCCALLYIWHVGFHVFKMADPQFNKILVSSVIKPLTATFRV